MAARTASGKEVELRARGGGGGGVGGGGGSGVTIMVAPRAVSSGTLAAGSSGTLAAGSASFVHALPPTPPSPLPDALAVVTPQPACSRAASWACSAAAVCSVVLVLGLVFGLRSPAATPVSALVPPTPTRAVAFTVALANATNATVAAVTALHTNVAYYLRTNVAAGAGVAPDAVAIVAITSPYGTWNVSLDAAMNVQAAPWGSVVRRRQLAAAVPAVATHGGRALAGTTDPSALAIDVTVFTDTAAAVDAALAFVAAVNTTGVAAALPAFAGAFTNATGVAATAWRVDNASASVAPVALASASPTPSQTPPPPAAASASATTPPAEAAALTTVLSGLVTPSSLAIGGGGVVYVNNFGNDTLLAWTPAAGALRYVANLRGVLFVAADTAGNAYYAGGANTLYRIDGATFASTALAATGASPAAVAVDASGNVFWGDRSGLQRWSVSTSTATTLATFPVANKSPWGLTVNSAGTVVYLSLAATIYKWTQAAGITPLAPTGATFGADVLLSLDAGGNLYIADALNNAVLLWTAATNAITTLVPASAGLISPMAAVPTAAGAVLIVDMGGCAIKQYTP